MPRTTVKVIADVEGLEFINFLIRKQFGDNCKISETPPRVEYEVPTITVIVYAE